MNKTGGAQRFLLFYYSKTPNSELRFLKICLSLEMLLKVMN